MRLNNIKHPLLCFTCLNILNNFGTDYNPYLSIMELWKHKQNDVFQSYGNDRIKGVDTEDFLQSWMIGCNNKAIKIGHL